MTTIDRAPDETLNRTFAALGDPTRRAILERLREGSATVGELAEPFDMSLNAVSKHIQVLERAGLLHREARGRERHCMLRPMPLRAATSWTEDFRRFWEERLDALERYLGEQDSTDEEAER